MRKRVFDNRSRQEVGARDVSTDVLILVVLVLDSNVKKELPSISLLFICIHLGPLHTVVSCAVPLTVLL